MLLISSAVGLLNVLDQRAEAQTRLPEIVVTAPNPIVRRATARPAAPSRARARVSPPLPTCRSPSSADRHRPVRHRHGRAERRKFRRNAASTLGDLLFDKPGITGSSFAPGAAEPPDHPRSRRQPRRHRRERYRRRRRLRSRRGPFRADRSSDDQPGRSDSRAGDACATARSRSAAW